MESVEATKTAGPGVRIGGWTIRLVTNIKEFYKWISFWAFTIIAALPFVWSSLPVELRNYIPEKYLPLVAVVVALGGLAGRMIDQNKNKAP
jgi:hypothetical protein